MNNHLLRRRRLLWYFGLGAVGVGGAVIGSGVLKTNTPTQTATLTFDSNSTATATEVSDPALPIRQPLPEFQGISQWLNSPPLKVSALKGNVVLVQFWTFACINCQRTLPYITRWHRQYEARGLRVIGVHTPELPFERDVDNVKQALKQHQITYPVPIDNDYRTWNTYQNDAWPHLYLADRNGLLRYDHVGEGAYDETEKAIQILLG